MKSIETHYHYQRVILKFRNNKTKFESMFLEEIDYT